MIEPTVGLRTSIVYSIFLQPHNPKPGMQAPQAQPTHLQRGAALPYLNTPESLTSNYVRNPHKDPTPVPSLNPAEVPECQGCVTLPVVSIVVPFWLNQMYNIRS